VTKYQKRISDPFLDRIDTLIELQKTEQQSGWESSAAIRKRVHAAPERQWVCFEGSDIVCNSDTRMAEVRNFCKLDEAGDSLVRSAMSKLNLTARGYHRVLKLAHTIADLAGFEEVQSTHLAEALQYHPKVNDEMIDYGC
jgi:magnesium chelatase family protein